MNAIGSLATAFCLSILMLGASLLVWAPGLALSGMTSTFVRTPALRLAAVPLGSALAGWLLFWAWFTGPAIGYSASVLIVVLSVTTIALKPRNLIDRDIRYPLAFSLLICLIFFCLVGDRGNLLGGSVMVSGRLWATLDNDLPRMFADELIKGRTTFPQWVWDEWKYSDRPPLQTGMIMIAYPFVAARYAQLVYLMLGIAANGLWIFGIWSFLRAFDLPERQIGLAIVALSMVGAIYVNTVYTWPKMLGGALTVAAATTVFLKDGTARSRSLLSAALAALSMLAHGSAAFGLIGIFFAGQRNIRAWGLKNFVIGVCVAAVCYLPWVGFQKFFDPPGDRLIKYHLAGTSIGDGEIDPRPPLEAIVSSYWETGLYGTIKNKIVNVRQLVGDPTIFSDWRGWQPLWKGSIANELRFHLDQKIGTAPGLLLIGVFAMVWYRDILRERWALTAWALVITSSLAYVVLEFGTEFSSAWLITAPYSLLLLWCTLGAVTLVQINRPWAYGVLIGHALSFLLLWAINVPSASEEFNDGSLAVGMKVGAVLTAMGIAFLLANYGRSSVALRLSTVRAAAFRKSALSLAKTCLIGLRSGVRSHSSLGYGRPTWSQRPESAGLSPSQGCHRRPCQSAGLSKLSGRTD